MSGQSALGGASDRPSTPRATTPRELPSGSILSSGPAFERGQLSQSLIDVLALCAGALVAGVFGACVGISAWFLVFHRFIGS